MLNIIEGIELIECNEIVDSDHRGHLTDMNQETHFGEDFNREIEIERRLLNHNKRTHRIFFEMYDELLNATPIENELNYIEMHEDRAKMEQIDKDITFLLQKVRSKVTGETKEIRGCKEKMKKHYALQCWNVVVKKKQGKNESNVRIKRRKKEAEIAGN